MNEKQLQQIFYSAMGVLSLALAGLGLFSAGGEGLAFGIFAFMTIGGSLICIWERSVVRSAFALLATFGGVAGLFLLLGADFLAMAQILIYVGGILALILFGVMLSPPDMNERKLSRIGLGLLGVGGAFAWVGAKVAATVSWASSTLPPPAASCSAPANFSVSGPRWQTVTRASSTPRRSM